MKERTRQEPGPTGSASRCGAIRMFIPLIGDDQAHKQLPSTLFLRLLQLAIACTDRYEPWDQDSWSLWPSITWKVFRAHPLITGARLICPHPSQTSGSKETVTGSVSPLETLVEPLSSFLPSFLSEERGSPFLSFPYKLTSPG